MSKRDVLLDRASVAATLWQFAPPLLLVGCALAMLLAGADTAVFVGVRAALLPLGERFWSATTLLGDGLVAPLLIVPFLRRRPQLLWEGTLAALLATAYTHVLKPLVHMPRPAALLDIPVIGPRLLAGSFPSGHTAAAFTVCALLLLAGVLPTRVARTASIFVASLVGLSRIVVGAHWPTDVLAGAAGGWICALAALALAHRWPAGAGSWTQRILMALLTAIALADLFGHDTGYPAGIALQRCVALGALAILTVRAIRDLRNMPK